jgi:glycosyltransferase involved in cell wall biosynthesis
MLVSVLICTRDRPEKLRRALLAIAQLSVPLGADFEVLVLDNGSLNDLTASTCRDLQSALSGRLRGFHLPIAGKSRAANAGFKLSRGDIVAFLDDDIVPRKDWLAVICQHFSEDPGLGVITGRVELLDKEDLPVGVRLSDRRTVLRDLADLYLLIGCNLAIRREVVDRIGLFDVNLGPGSRAGFHEDHDFFYRAWRAGEKVVYEPSLFVYHGHGRQSAAQEVSIKRSYAMGRGAFFAKQILKCDWLILRTTYWELWPETRNLFGRRRQSSAQHLSWLLSGFYTYCLLRASRIIRPQDDRFQANQFLP